MKYVRCWAVLCCAFVSAASASAQTVLFDSNGFESYNLGALKGQNGWQVDGTGNYVVANGVGVGGSRGVSVGGGVTDWAYPNLNFTPTAGQIIVVEADLARTLSGTTPSFAYGIDFYTPEFLRITRFGLVADSGVIRPFYTGSGGTIFIGPSSVSANSFQSFRAELNFATDTMNLFINGTNAASNVALLLNATTLLDADFQVSSNAAATDSGFLDNYRVTAVPEPTTLVLSLAAIPSLFWFRRRQTGCRFGS